MKLESLKPEEYRKLVEKVEQFCKDFPAKNKDRKPPTFRQIAKRYRINHDDVESIIQDSDMLDEIVGYRSGQGSLFEIEHRGDYFVEYIG